MFLRIFKKDNSSGLREFVPEDYHHHSQILCNFFVERGFEASKLSAARQEVGKMDRMDLLKDHQKDKKDAQTIFVCDWHPSLRRAPSILKQHFPVLQSDERLSKIFLEPPTVAFRRPRTIRNILVRNDINPPPKKSTSEWFSSILYTEETHSHQRQEEHHDKVERWNFLPSIFKKTI